jgi:5-formyltetrahydrofolate cyclo-ligase
MIMPGVAFDPERNRIGYGKGFYDRYLQDKPALRTIAIGYDCQMVAEIQTEETDVKPMQVICL